MPDESGGMQKNVTSAELLEKIRELDAELATLPLHAHAFALNILTSLGNHRATCAQREAEDKLKSEQIQKALASGPGMLV